MTAKEDSVSTLSSDIFITSGTNRNAGI